MPKLRQLGPTTKHNYVTVSQFHSLLLPSFTLHPLFFPNSIYSACPLVNFPTHPATHTHTRTPTLNHPHTHSLIHSHTLTHSLTHSFTHSFTHSPSHSLIHLRSIFRPIRELLASQQRQTWESTRSSAATATSNRIPSTAASTAAQADIAQE